MDDGDDLSAEEWQRFLDSNPPTLPPFAFTFRGVDDEETRIALVNAMSPLAAFMSRVVPLGGLDGITIATDYGTALAELDRGISTSQTLEPTKEDFGSGVAMSVGVVREGRLKTHVVFEAYIIGALLHDDPRLRALSTHTFMHELGHVAEHTLDEMRFGGAMLTPITDRYERQLYGLSHACWGEYYALRVSASWGPEAMNGLRELLQGSLEKLKENVRSVRTSVGPFMGRGNDDAARAIIQEVSQLMKFAGYVIGHAHGAEMPPLEPSSVHEALLDELGLTSWFDELGTALDDIYDARDRWDDLSVFHPLHRAFEAACLAFRLELRRSDEFDLAWRIWF